MPYLARPVADASSILAEYNSHFGISLGWDDYSGKSVSQQLVAERHLVYGPYLLIDPRAT